MVKGVRPESGETVIQLDAVTFKSTSIGADDSVPTTMDVEILELAVCAMNAAESCERSRNGVPATRSVTGTTSGLFAVPGAERRTDAGYVPGSSPDGFTLTEIFPPSLLWTPSHGVPGAATAWAPAGGRPATVMSMFWDDGGVPLPS